MHKYTPFAKAWFNAVSLLYWKLNPFHYGSFLVTTLPCSKLEV